MRAPTQAYILNYYLLTLTTRKIMFVCCVGTSVIYTALNCCSSDVLDFHMHNSAVPDSKH
jgi:hypothetical protein